MFAVLKKTRTVKEHSDNIVNIIANVQGFQCCIDNIPSVRKGQDKTCTSTRVNEVK